MKKILFVLPLSALLTYCSSTKPAISPGISNVQVNGEAAGSTTMAGTQARDWGYQATRDTALSGSWVLMGMTAADGSWKSAEEWNPQTDSTNAAAATGNVQSNEPFANSPQTASSSKTFGEAMYDTSVHYFDTAAFVQKINDNYTPFAYWQRLPEINIMPSLGVYTGNTGCNSMSGSFNFSNNDIKFDQRIRTSKMACNDYDESAFLANLLKVDGYTIDGNVLELKQGNNTLLKFTRQTE